MLCYSLLCYIEKRFLYAEEEHEIREQYPKETKEYDEADEFTQYYLSGYYQGLGEANLKNGSVALKTS